MTERIGMMTRHVGPREAKPAVPPRHQITRSADGTAWLVWPVGMRPREAWVAVVQDCLTTEAAAPAQLALFGGGR